MSRRMNVKSVIVALIVALALTSVNAARRVVPLDGQWTLTEAGGRATAVEVPHAWNIMDGADGEGVMSVEKWKKNSSCSDSYERKRVTYSRSLPNPKSDRRYFVRCEGASITAAVRVNGETAGKHVGAFTAFCFEVTDLLKASGNVLEIDVDNFVRDDSPPVNADFTMYGGLCRHVSLIETPQVCIDPTRDGGSGLWFLPNPDTGDVEVRVAVSGAPDEVRRFKVDGFRLWSPETPVVYTQTVALASGDAVTGTFGFRKAEFRDDGFYLNGVKRKLRGVNYHQDREGKGWAVSDADREADIREIQEMGADAVRTAHYPHSDFTYDLCDRTGLAVWCEHPNVNGLRFTEAFCANAWRQAREMVVQLRNHPSIVCWSIFNELYNKVKMTEGEPESMMEEFRDYVKGLDPTRAVAAASDRPGKVRLNAIPETLGFNRYPYWYDDQNSMRMLTDAIFAANPGRKSIAIAEYGAGGSCGQHEDAGTPCVYNGDFHSEEYEAYVHALDYRDIAADDRLWGSFVWCMYDFGSDCRLEGAKHGRNDKGLVSFDHRIRKEAWWLYKAAWSPKPVLHLVGKNWKATTNAVTTVLAFSNRDEVRLTVNGRTYPAQRPNAGSVIWKDVSLGLGNNVIEIAADGLSERAVWTRVRSPNYDPAKIGTYTLEDPLTFVDGRKVRDAADWETRRKEIRDLFEREMYGRVPSAPETLVTETLDERVTMGGFAVRKQVRMWFKADRTGPQIDWLVLLPRQVKKPVPAILFLNYGGNHELLPDSAIRVPTCWLRPSADFRRPGNRATAATRGLYADPGLRTVYPVGTILSRGYAVVTACHGEVSPDPYGQELTGRYASSDVLSLFPYDPAREDNPTTLGAWAWALMRGMDLLEREPAVDAKRVAVTGSSRLGKAALIAGAFDSRFWAVAPNQTGGGGVPLMKRNYGEDAEALVRIFPHWFCKGFRKWVDREKERPMDQHLLLAMVAPRKLLVEGFCDPHYDTEGEYLSAKAASCAWRFLGGAGLPEVAFPDPYDTSAIGTDVGYYRRTEKHGISAYDWTRLLDFLDRK